MDMKEVTVDIVTIMNKTTLIPIEAHRRLLPPGKCIQIVLSQGNFPKKMSASPRYPIEG